MPKYNTKLSQRSSWVVASHVTDHGNVEPVTHVWLTGRDSLGYCASLGILSKKRRHLTSMHLSLFSIAFFTSCSMPVAMSSEPLSPTTLASLEQRTMSFLAVDDSGSPIEGATAFRVDANGSRLAQSDSNGSVRTAIDPNIRIIRIAAHGFKTMDVSLPEGACDLGAIRFERGASIEVTRHAIEGGHPAPRLLLAADGENIFRGSRMSTPDFSQVSMCVGRIIGFRVGDDGSGLTAEMVIEFGNDGRIFVPDVTPGIGIRCILLDSSGMAASQEVCAVIPPTGRCEVFLKTNVAIGSLHARILDEERNPLGRYKLAIVRVSDAPVRWKRLGGERYDTVDDGTVLVPGLVVGEIECISINELGNSRRSSGPIIVAASGQPVDVVMRRY